MKIDVLISSVDGVISVKYNKNNLAFKDVITDSVIESKALDIITYVSEIKTPEDKVDIALDFIKNNATPEQKLTLIELYPKWKVGASYVIGNELQYNGKLYQVIQAHTSQSDWTPDIVPALFKVIQPEGVIPDWVQPKGSTDAYKIGDKVLFEGKTYESVINANTWSPTGYPAGWKLI